MTAISKEQLSRYQQLGQIPSMEMAHTRARAIYQRMESEGVCVRAMRDPQVGMFMAPFVETCAGLDIACIGVPMENSIPLRTSTAEGPAAIREWSQWMGPVHELWGTIPFDESAVGDFGDMSFASGDLADRIEQIYRQFKSFSDAGIATLSLGGEHTMTYPIMKALGESEPLGMIHIDAHADTGGSVIPDDPDVLSINDASPFRHAVLSGALDPTRCVQIGIRGRGEHFWDFSHQTGMRVITATEFYDRGVDSVMAEALEIIGRGPCYFTIDNDGIDPVDMPATGLPEPFGIRAIDVRKMIRAARPLHIVGADFCELSPRNDPTEQSANISAALCFELLCLLVESRRNQGKTIRKTYWRRPEQEKKQ